jgi:hypothetical protein
MATPSATIADLRIDDQAVAFSVTVDGPEGSKGKGDLIIYDAAGTERSRTDLGELTAGQKWDAWMELPVQSLGDGDYAAWVFVVTDGPDGTFGTNDEKGISFLVGRGRVYPSHEGTPKREITEPPALSPLRLEGSWVVFDMTNSQAYDVPVTHTFMIGQENGRFQEFHGTELLQAKATQQGHYLLPADLADGKYLATVGVQVEGSDFPSVGLTYILVDRGVFTQVS